jgi:hypothetical protein
MKNSSRGRVVRLRCFGSMAGNAGELGRPGASVLHARWPAGTRSSSSDGLPSRPLLCREARAGVAEAEPLPDLWVAGSGALQPPRSAGWRLALLGQPTGSCVLVHSPTPQLAVVRWPTDRASGCALITDRGPFPELQFEGVWLRIHLGC